MRFDARLELIRMRHGGKVAGVQARIPTLQRVKAVLPDGNELELPEGASGLDAARAIGPRLADATAAVVVDGEAWAFSAASAIACARKKSRSHTSDGTRST